ncbi:hypothetical protein [Phytoactinopolyspora endophytica]|uniref:hypothetical protein n=1 Tax=Phytoactinopolyspora endophytica TaxID=1642495 RepID=UPI00101D7654|nr:hypothetical protein [Phytoactinopolyspora endophytica]
MNDMSESTAGIEQFIADNVPRPARLTSAVLEFAAIQRGLVSRRLNRNILLVDLPSGDKIPFRGLNGPDSSEPGQQMCSWPDAMRGLLQTRGLPVAPYSTFEPTQRKRASRYAERIGTPVTITPARRAPGPGSTAAVTGSSQFRSAWRRATDAYERNSGGPVLVEQHVPGRRFHVLVVDDRVVAVTWVDGAEHIGMPVLSRDDPTRPASGRLVDVTERTHPRLQRLAIDAVAALPGLAYAGVDIFAPDIDDAAGQAVVAHVDGAPPPLAMFPTDGPARDIAGAILEHYVRSPRWKAARDTAHVPPQSTGQQSSGSAVEPLLT